MSLTFAISTDAANSITGSKEDKQISSALSNALWGESEESQFLKSEAIGTLSTSRDVVNFDDQGMAQV